jgi:DNA-binding LytR/AlgR family response regulator
MHIAICDDNVADRKQLERLLKRESDRRSGTTGILYTDSYGTPEAMLSNPMQYDVFYIDMCQTGSITGQELVEKLTAKGVHAPIVMCCSAVDYRGQVFPENVIFLNKPIQTAELSESLDHALLIKAQAPSMIELREDKETLYITEDELIYAVESARHVTVTLTEGRQVVTNTTAENLFTQLEKHPTFFAPSHKVIVNARYIQKLGFFKVIMKDGTVFKVHGDCMDYAKYAFREFRQE